ncbi:helix-turn-helix domain-containing protein [Pseudactinotalea sp. Z1739]|uniref:helix-turn-helix domain-containing protein n=1 Tax=Pseudactinotalea sp. Z1739 TaxID=3413028 RepID=UPI003C7BEDFA
MNSATAAMRLGPSIKQARTQQGISLRRLAQRSGVPRTTIERIEQEKIEHPRPNILHALGTALEIPVSDLYSLANYPTVEALPSFAPYLRARYQGLSAQAITELDIYFRTLAERDGIALDGPAVGEDET